MPKPTVFLAILALLAGQAHAQALDEAATVASEVLSQNGWKTELDRCPSELMPKRQVLDYLDANSCGPGLLSRCLSKCVAVDPGACYWLGQAIQREKADQRAAELLYQRSCKLGIVSGCTNRAAGMLNDSRDDSSVLACTAETFSKGCAFDDPWACTMYALQLSRGMGVKRDDDLALKVLRKSCKYGPDDEACEHGMRLKKLILEDAGNAGQKR